MIKPSRYDDDGYVVRHWRGVLPSNTLACLAGLTEDVIAKKELGPVRIKLHLLDESVDRVFVKRICRSQRGRHTRAVVCLVGVQTNQFPRASDLALEFRKKGLTVMLGGFHVSGYLALSRAVPTDIARLLDAGVTIVKGEVEETWSALLRDAASGRLKPLYDFLDHKPELLDKPLPAIRKKYLRKFVASNFGTLDCGRGCPFDCSFCTIINVQGRRVRSRSAEQIAQTVRRTYERNGISFYFFTDDNFARNRNWEAIFDALTRLREEGIPLRFMMQVDALSWKIERFVEKARRAGCSNVFIGMESLNPANLKSAGKSQNHVEDYRRLVDAFRSREISPHVSYIIGFPGDTPESVRRDLACLTDQVQADHASFFMLTPLPGSKDHAAMAEQGTWMHADYNLYDADHAVTEHSTLTGDDWKKLYVEAWNTFYSFENMKAVLLRSSKRTYWNNLVRFMWYRNSIRTEGCHPMMSGLFRLKGRTSRRPGYPVLGRWEYFKMRLHEVWAYGVSLIAVSREMQELWLQTRQPTEAERRIGEEVNRLGAAARGRLKVADIQLAHFRAKLEFPTLRVPSKLRLFWAKWYPALAPSKVYTRRDLDVFWQTIRQRWTERKWFLIPLHRVVSNLFRDVQVSLVFALHVLFGLASASR
ncbi:MAG: radical SAM protein [Pseudomonadota bacterium]